MSSRRPPLFERLAFAKMEVWLAGLVAVLCLVGGALWASAAIQRNIFPGPMVREIATAVKGVPGDFRPARVRLTSQFFFSPREFPASKYNELLPPEDFGPVTLAGEMGDGAPVVAGMRVANPGGETRYFLVYGSFVFDKLEKTIGTILIDSHGTVHRAWPEEVEGGTFFGLHIGLALAPNGTFAVNTHGIMTAYDWCGGKLWQAPWQAPETSPPPDWNGPESHDWHHDIIWHNGAFYSMVGFDVVAVDQETGQISDRVHGTDYYQWGWDQGLSLVDARSDLYFRRSRLTPETAADLLPDDAFHINKVDVLTTEEAGDYPGFEAGDLLLSLRDLNLVAVLRPSEKRFVWWRYGLTSRQHDTSFVEGGIEVFDNAPFTDPPRPRILRLDLDENRAETVFDLSQWNMEMPYTGNFERFGERLLTVDDYAGRMIAGRTDGTIDVVFENGFDADGRDWARLLLRNATEISPEDFDRLEAGCGTASGG